MPIKQPKPIHWTIAYRPCTRPLTSDHTATSLTPQQQTLLHSYYADFRSASYNTSNKHTSSKQIATANLQSNQQNIAKPEALLSRASVSSRVKISDPIANHLLHATKLEPIHLTSISATKICLHRSIPMSTHRSIPHQIMHQQQTCLHNSQIF